MVKQITLKKLVALACLSFSSLSSWAYELVIPEGTTEITWKDGYAGDDDITSVVIPNSVTVIGGGAFSGCTGLTSVTIPNSVTKIGDYAFYDCSSLTSVTIPNSVTKIGDYAFYDCSSLTSITIPDGEIEIGEEAFYECSPDTVVAKNISVTWRRALGWKIFKTLVYTGTLTEWISEDRGDMTSMVGEWDGDGYVHGSIMVEGKNLREMTSVTIPDGIKTIGGSAFRYCSSLTSVTIPNSVTAIGDEAFDGCASLTSIVIPNSVTTIGEKAFYGCTGLTSITIPDGEIEIGEKAFFECSPDTVVAKNISDTWRYKLGRFKTLVYTGTLTEWISEDRGDMTSMVGEWDGDGYVHGSIMVEGKNLREMTSVTIPDGIKTIGGSAFGHCTGLTSVTIPNSVTTIGKKAFDGCTGLTSITIPNSVTAIGDGAFYGCTGLTSITIPNSVTTIGDGAFADCTGLTSVTIPNSVTSIGEDAFYDCKSLTSIVIPASVNEISWGAFNGCTNLKKVTCLAKVPPMAEDEEGYDTFGNYNAYLYIPCDNLEDYDLHQVWGKFKYIKCLEANTVEDHPVTDVVVTPNSQEANFEWPTTDNAATYTLTIQKDGEVFCTLVFNANGQLTTIDFSSLRSGSDGFSFNVTGLRENSEYSYLMEVKDKSQKVINSYSGAFKTLKVGDYVENISIDEMPITIEDGVIVVDAKKDDNVSIYNMQGQCLVSQMGSVSFQVPSDGVYVVECGNKAVKVIVK